MRNGTGISVAELRLWSFSGTGLGLAISKQLVELMGGEIGVNSVEGKGSTLHLAIGSDPDEVREIVEVYLAHMMKSLDDLKAAIKAGDAAAVELIGHNCAGTSANCGMTAVVDSLSALEEMGRKNLLTGADVLAQKASDEFERVKAFLEENFQPVAV